MGRDGLADDRESLGLLSEAGALWVISNCWSPDGPTVLLGQSQGRKGAAQRPGEAFLLTA